MKNIFYILFYLLNDIQNGFYIDVGANDPNLYSVTKAFYQRGWYGINIEPLPEKYRLLGILYGPSICKRK